MAKKDKDEDVEIFDKSKPKNAVKLAEDLIKKYGEDTVVRAGRKMDVIPTGLLSLDLAIGIGGWPRGRFSDLYGKPSSGKTMVATIAVKECQKLGGLPVYIDAENSWDERWASVLGVDFDPTKLIHLQPDSGEQAFDMAEDSLKKGADLVVIDSTAALVPQDCIDRPMTDGAMIGRQAALISRGIQKLNPLVKKTQSVVLFIGQVRKNIGG